MARRPSVPTSPNPDKEKKKNMVKSAKIEFSSMEDKKTFLEKFREVQGFFFAGLKEGTRAELG
jgi:hypothetical protein